MTRGNARQKVFRRVAGVCATALVLLSTASPAVGDPPVVPAPRAVPAPTNTTSVVTVKVGGDRTGDQAIAPLAGTTLGLYEEETGGAPLFTCVSDVDGDCSFTVTGTGTGNNGPNRGARFWVRQVAAPSGWFANASFATGVNGPTGTTPYRFRTPQLFANNTYRSTETGANGFMVSSGSTNLSASGGTWQQSRNNPVLLDQCGLRVALIMDLSGSMDGSVDELKAAADAFVDALQGTPSTMARFTFATVSPAENAGPNSPGLQSVSTLADAAAFKASYAAWTDATAEGSTNWDRALYVPATATSIYDVAVVITDGMPTRYGSAGTGGNGNTTRLREVENGVFSANALKRQGTRVLAVGVGNGVAGIAGLNLAALSGPTLYDGTNVATADYYQEDTFADAAAALRALALAPCTPTLSVIKQIRADDGTVFNAPAGWTFDASTTTPGVTIESPQTTTADGTGAVNFPLDYAPGSTGAVISVSEQQQPGYTLIPVGTKNAVCTDKVSEQPVEVTNDPGGGPGFTVNVSRQAAVTCTMLNQAPPDVVPASLTVDKEWVVTSAGATTTYPQGQQPSDLNAALRLTDPGGNGTTPQDWGTSRDGYAEGEQVTIAETPTIAPGTDCELTRAELDGQELPLAAPAAAVTLTGGTNRYLVTNYVRCSTTLTLAKRVQGGDADPTSWTLQSFAAPGALPGPTGVTGTPQATTEVTPGARYQLAEQLNSADPMLLNYRQIDNRTDFQTNPLSTGSMNCIGFDSDGDEVLGYNDGINGGVEVPLGLHAVCTAINETVPLTLVKEVVGGTAVPADWTITATPVDPDPAGVPAQTVPGTAGPDGVTITVRPGQTYAISESDGPAGYQLSSITCRTVTGEIGPAAITETITVRAGQEGECTVTNTFAGARLTLTKVVVNDDGGTATTADFPLTATGADQTVTGRTGDPEVTGVAVIAGDYTLSEVTRDDYTASAWACRTGGGDQLAVRDAVVTLAADTVVECVITNDDKASPPPPPPPPAPPGPHGPPAPGPIHHADTGWLASTGFPVGSFAVTGLLVLVAGVWLVARARRRDLA